MRGQIEDRLSNERGKKGSGHKEAYVRFRALRAAIVRIVLSRNLQQPKIDRFFDCARKKSLEGNPGVLGYDYCQVKTLVEFL